MKCSGLDCLLAMDATTVEKASSGGWGPTVDDVSLSAAPTDLIAAGRYNNKVPVLIGSNRDEMACVHGPVRTMLCSDTHSCRDSEMMPLCQPGYRYFTVSEKVPNQLTELGMELLLRADGLNESAIRAIKEVYRPGGGYPYPADLGNYSIWCEADGLQL